MKIIQAIFEHGVFRPVGLVDLPDPCKVEFEPRMVEPEKGQPTLAEVYAVLAKRYESGQTDVAARHDEHQP